MLQHAILPVLALAFRFRRIVLVPSDSQLIVVPVCLPLTIALPDNMQMCMLTSWIAVDGFIFIRGMLMTISDDAILLVAVPCMLGILWDQGL